MALTTDKHTCTGEWERPEVENSGGGDFWLDDVTILFSDDIEIRGGYNQEVISLASTVGQFSVNTNDKTNIFPYEIKGEEGVEIQILATN